MFYVKKKISPIKGFTLAEIMLGMFLLGIVLVTVTGVFVSGLSGARKAQKKIITLNLAESMLDSILLMDYSSIDAIAAPSSKIYDGTKPSPDPPSGNFPPAPYPVSSIAGGKAKYKITSAEMGTGAKIKKITVEVIIESTDKQGSSRAVLTGFKAQ